MPTDLYGINDNFNLETAHVPPALIRKFHLAKLLKNRRFDEIRKDLERLPVGFSLDWNADLELGLKKIGITAEAVTLWGSGEPYREFLYADDLADACVFLMENCAAKDLNEFVNIGSGEDLQIKVLASMIQEATGFKGEIVYDSSKPDGTSKKLLDVSRMRSLGWSPKTSLEEGIRKTYEWYLNVPFA